VHSVGDVGAVLAGSAAGVADRRLGVQAECIGQDRWRGGLGDALPGPNARGERGKSELPQSDPDVVGVEVASGSIAREHPGRDGIGRGLPVGNRLADRDDEFIEWVFEDNGVLTKGDGLSTVVDGDVLPLQGNDFVGRLPKDEDEGGHQPILGGHVGVSKQMLELLDLFVNGFFLGGVSSMRRDLQLRQCVNTVTPAQASSRG
jgi:hypothetical protein